MLLLAEKHYAASRMLLDSENARIAAQSAATRLVLQHNMEMPRFFSEPSSWNGLELNPLTWEDYVISGALEQTWSATEMNMLHLRARRKRSFGQLDLPLRHIRFEDFALYSDAPQSLATSTLFDGNVFVRGGMAIDQPVRFRDAVHNDVTPAHYASFRKRNSVRFEFPVFNAPAWPSGLNMELRAAPFWNTDHYEINLDRLDLSRAGDQWIVRYEGTFLAQIPELVLSFDEDLHITQTFHRIPHVPGTKPEAALYIVSKKDVSIRTSRKAWKAARISIRSSSAHRMRCGFRRSNRLFEFRPVCCLPQESKSKREMRR
jgi:hypothetical protein